LAILQTIFMHLFADGTEFFCIPLNLFHKLIMVGCVIYCIMSGEVFEQWERLHNIYLPCGMNSRNFPSMSSARSSSLEVDELTPWNISE
jgi:hypothetical protein